MKALKQAIDKFSRKHKKFGIPQLIRYVVFISAAILIISMMDRTRTFLGLLAFHPGLILRGQIWRLVTWVFIPLDPYGYNYIFSALLLYFYYFIGTTLERVWGKTKFTIYYLLGVILNIIYGWLMWNTSFSFDWLSPNFLNLSMFFAFASIFPDQTFLLFFIIPLKAKWLALINALFFAYSIVIELYNAHLAPALLPLVALLNFFIFCGDDVIHYLHPQKIRRSPDTINFRRAVRNADKEFGEKNYRHKCDVCGKTDASHPDLEFRYCSRCSGYHCFCIEHINSHIHFQ